MQTGSREATDNNKATAINPPLPNWHPRAKYAIKAKASEFDPDQRAMVRPHLSGAMNK
jgi:hypothetical protein